MTKPVSRKTTISYQIDWQDATRSVVTLICDGSGRAKVTLSGDHHPELQSLTGFSRRETVESELTFIVDISGGLLTPIPSPLAEDEAVNPPKHRAGKSDAA